MTLNTNLLGLTEQLTQGEISNPTSAQSVNSNLRDSYVKDFDSDLAKKSPYSASELNSNIKRAIKSGADAARRGLVRPTERILQTRSQYTPEQIEAYLNAYDKKVAPLQEVQIRRAKSLGSQAARQGFARPTEEELQARNQYTSEQIKAYWDGYDKKIGTLKEQQINKAKTIGAQAARKGYAHPTIEVLQKRNKYTLEQAEAYLKAYDQAKSRRQLKSGIEQNDILLNLISNPIENNLTYDGECQKTNENYDTDVCASIPDDLLNLLLQQYDEVNPFWVEVDRCANNVKNNICNLESFYTKEDSSSNIDMCMSFLDHLSNLLSQEKSYVNSFWEELDGYVNNNDNLNNTMPFYITNDFYNHKFEGIVNTFDSVATPVEQVNDASLNLKL